MNDTVENDPRLFAIPDIHGHAKGEHKAFGDERPIPLSARMLFLWFYHACRRGWPRFLMVTDHMNYLTFEDPAAISLVRRALKLAQAGDLYGAAETASVEVGHAAVVSEGLRRGMHFSIGAEVDNDPRSRPDAQNIVDAMKPDGMIRSVHFLTIDHPVHGPSWNWPFDNPEFADVHETVGTAKTWEVYMATLLDVVERLPGNIVGHFYVPALFGHWPDDATLDRYEDQIVDACESRGMAIEFNTRFLYRSHSDEEKAKYLAAHRRLLTKCKAKNVGIAVGSDAHSPKDQGRAFKAVLALLDECEINELIFPIAGRLARVALRVERKVDAVPEPPAPPVEERRVARRPRPSEAPARDEASETRLQSHESAVPLKVAKPRAKRGKGTTVEAAATRVAGEAADEEMSVGASGDPEPSAPLDEQAATGPHDEQAATGPHGEQAATGPHGEQAASAPHDGQAASAPHDGQAIVDVTAEFIVGDAVTAIVIAPEIEPIVADAAEPNAAEPAGAQEFAVSDKASDPTAENEPVAVAVVIEPARPDEAWGPQTELGEPEGVGDDVRRKPRAKPAPAKLKGTTSRLKAAAAKSNPAAKKAAKPAAKTPTKKAQTKKASAKKATAKKAAPKKPPARTAPPKKAAVRAVGAKKTAPKKSAAKKNTLKKRAQRKR